VYVTRASNHAEGSGQFDRNHFVYEEYRWQAYRGRREREREGRERCLVKERRKFGEHFVAKDIGCNNIVRQIKLFDVLGLKRLSEA
jgi:hypothetical protein